MTKIRLVALGCLALVACGGDDDDSGPTPPETGPEGELVFRSEADRGLIDAGITADEIVIDEPGFVSELWVDLDVEHTRVTELTVFLTHQESGARIRLLRRPPSEADDLDLQLRDDAARDVQFDVALDAEESAYAGGTFNPFEPLGFFYSDELAGTWTLEISDNSQGDSGRLNSWALRIAVADDPPPAALVFGSPRFFRFDGTVGVTQDQFVRYRYTGDETGAPSVATEVEGIDAEFHEVLAEGVISSGVVSYTSSTEGEKTLEFSLAIGDQSDTASWRTRFSAPRASGLDLQAQLSPAQLGYPGFEGNDCWGWTDPEDGTEYALVGTEAGISFVDVSDATAPVVLGKLDTHTRPSAWRDVKVYKDHAFVVSEATDHGMQVFDLTELRDLDGASIVSLEETAHFDGFGNAHNIAIDEQSGFAYAIGATDPGYDGLCGGGLYIIDISTPTAPVDAGCFGGADPVVVEQGGEYPTDAYIHDAQCVTYDGPDTDYVGRELCVSADGQVNQSGLDFLAIADVTDKGDVTQVARLLYADGGYAHQGWLSEDHRYFFLNDEFDEFSLESKTRTLVFDLIDLERPELVGVFENDSFAIGHNSYTLDGLLYMANYTSGLRVVALNADEQGAISVPGMEELAFFDTYPEDDAVEDGRGFGAFSGAWSNYPYFDSGNIIVSDIERGLFILR